jgi:hypothetical protein
MTAERCAEITLQATYKRKRELLMGPGLVLAWFRLLAPGLLDRFMIDFLKATVRRQQAKQGGKD